MMNFDKCDRLFIKNAIAKGAVVRNVTKTDSMNFYTSYPKYYTMEKNANTESNVFIEKRLGDLKDTIIDDYEMKLIRKIPIYTFGINFTVLPVSTILTLLEGNTLDISELTNKLADYMKHTYQVESRINSSQNILVELSKMTSENDIKDEYKTTRIIIKNVLKEVVINKNV